MRWLPGESGTAREACFVRMEKRWARILWVAVIVVQRDQTMIEIPVSRGANYRIRMPKSSVSLEEPPANGWAWLAFVLLSVIRWALE